VARTAIQSGMRISFDPAKFIASEELEDSRRVAPVRVALWRFIGGAPPGGGRTR